MNFQSRYTIPLKMAKFDSQSAVAYEKISAYFADPARGGILPGPGKHSIKIGGGLIGQFRLAGTDFYWNKKSQEDSPGLRK